MSKENGMWFTTALIQLPLVRQVEGIQVSTPDDVFRVCADIASLAQESFHVLALDTKNRLNGRYMATLGVVNSCMVHPREVFRGAIMTNATSIIIVHNHPSGDVTPSAEDIRITVSLVNAGKIVDIKVLDHVILGPGKSGEKKMAYLSIREKGLCSF